MRIKRFRNDSNDAHLMKRQMASLATRPNTFSSRSSSQKRTKREGQRLSEDKRRAEGGPAAIANIKTFEPKDEPQAVWSSGDVR